MSVAIITYTCERDRANGREQAAWDTWLAAWGSQVEHHFMRASALGVADGYMFMPFKLQATCRRLFDKNIRHVFVSCVDTYIAVPRLLAAPRYDYGGHPCGDGHISGGCGYWLSWRAIQVLAFSSPYQEYEDVWTYRALQSAGIDPTPDYNYCNHAPLPDEWAAGAITAHLSRGTDVYEPVWMHNCHRSFLQCSP